MKLGLDLINKLNLNVKKERKNSHKECDKYTSSCSVAAEQRAGSSVVQYLTHSILLSYTWVQGGIGFSVGNEAAPSNISTKNGWIGPQLDNLYNIGMPSFPHIKPQEHEVQWRWEQESGLEEEVTVTPKRRRGRP